MSLEDVKINKKIEKNNDSKNNISNNKYATNFENLKYIPLNDNLSLLSLYKIFMLYIKFLKKNIWKKIILELMQKL